MCSYSVFNQPEGKSRSVTGTTFIPLSLLAQSETDTCFLTKMYCYIYIYISHFHASKGLALVVNAEMNHKRLVFKP